MHETTRRRFLTVLAAVAAMLAIPATAFAYAPSGGDFITCVAGGDNNIECEAGVFDAGSEVEVEATFNGTMVLDATLTANADGEVSFDFDVPDDEDGEVTVTLRGTFDGETKVLSDAIATVEDGEVIANAGFDSMTLLSMGLGALLLGGGVLAISRRRKSSSQA